MPIRFSIYRYNPETDARPRMQDYELPDEGGGTMLLDALLLLKQQDDSLGFRRSCREGVCGSDAMNVNGRNVLACIQPLKELRQPIAIRPLPGLPVIRDLIVDLSPVLRPVPRYPPVAHQPRSGTGSRTPADPRRTRPPGRAL